MSDKLKLLWFEYCKLRSEHPLNHQLRCTANEDWKREATRLGLCPKYYYVGDGSEHLKYTLSDGRVFDTREPL